jgi:hypothetical protein
MSRSNELADATRPPIEAACLSRADLGYGGIASWQGRPGGVVSSASPGVAYPKSRLSGCGAGRAGVRDVPWLPSRTRSCSGVSAQLAEHRVADVSPERSSGFLLGLPGRDLAQVVAPSGGVTAQLGDCG